MSDATPRNRQRAEEQFSRHGGRRHLVHALLVLVPLALTAWFAAQLRAAAAGNIRRLAWPWVPSLQVELSFQLDGLGLLFALLVTGMGTLVFLYAPAYMGATAGRGGLYAWLMLFMFSMLGVVLADNVIALFVFWELTSLASYLLIGFKQDSAAARAAALQALLVTALGGLALLAGLLLVAQAGGSYELSNLLAERQRVIASPLLTAAILLILLGVWTKSAHFPFHFWLPSAMAAPTPVSAFLHSATMVKAGVYLVARFSPMFCDLPAWEQPLMGVGAITALVGGAMGLLQTDLKRVLAYSTVSSLGTLTLLLGMGTPAAAKAGLAFLLAHAVYKGGLFLVAGTVDHRTGTRDLEKLGGLWRNMPWLATAAFLTAGSMAGLPPTSGFLAKELVYEAATRFSGWGWLVVLTLLVVNACFVAMAGLASVTPFASPRSRPDDPCPGGDWRLTVPPLVLGILGVFLALVPGGWARFAITPALAAVGHDAAVKLSLWHGWNLPLFLSGVSLAGGLALFAAVPGWRAWLPALRCGSVYGPEGLYSAGLAGLKAVAAWQTRWLQHGRLRFYLAVILASFVVLVGWNLVWSWEYSGGMRKMEWQPYELFIPVLIVAAAWMAMATSSRLAAVCALGVIGYAVAMLFVIYGAPDLAMTQLAIETLTVILFVLVLYRLPKFARLTGPADRRRDGLLAITAGGIMASIAWAATWAHVPSRLFPFFTDQSLPAAKGRNIVNVILIDFRGLDTLGEITVLAAAALGVYGLMRLVPATPEGRDTQAQRAATGGASALVHSVILSTATAYLMPLLLLFSLFLLLRGHNEPGGGFVGGLAAAAAFSLYAISSGVGQARRLLRLHPAALLGAGMGLAASSGLFALPTGRPYMTGSWSRWELPAIGKLGTPLLFDLGVYLVVVGMVLMIVFELAEE